MIRKRKLNRLPGYDYSRGGWYFVTICTKNKGEVLGKVENGVVSLNDFGRVVRNQWLWLVDRYKFLKHDEWIIMPDHVHGIMKIEIMDVVGGNGGEGDGENGREGDGGNGRDRSVQNGENMAIRSVQNGENMAIRSVQNKNKIKSISELIGAFKTTSSKMIHDLGFLDFRWHKSFYDEIIRDEIALKNIRKYIIENPRKSGNGRDHSVQNISR